MSPCSQPPHGAPLDFSKALTAEAWLPHLAGIDAVINAVGVLRDSAGRPLQAMHADAPIALFDACAAAGVRRVVQISALGIAHSATRYASTKRAADEHLLALTEQGRLNGCVLRPSVVFGAGGASSQLFLALARLPALLLPRGLQRACSPWPCATWRRGGAHGGFGCAVGPGRDRRTRGPAAGA